MPLAEGLESPTDPREHPLSPRAIAALSLPTALVLVTLALPLPAPAQDSDPAAVASKFLENLGQNCGAIWPLLSTGTQEQFRAAANRRERDRAGLPRPFVPEQEACSAATFGEFKRGSARIVRQQGDEAVVAVDLITRPSRYRYDIAPPAKVVTEEIRLMREAGSWRVVRQPREDITRGPGWRPKEFGPVDVLVPERFNPGLIDRFEATAVVRASADTLERALRDPQRWALALPGIKAVQPADPAGETPRVVLRFDEADLALPARVRLYAKPASPSREESSVMWDAEESKASPVHFRGSWKLKPHEDGSTRITLLVHLDIKQWPGDSARRIFSEERLAKAVLDLEKAAR